MRLEIDIPEHHYNNIMALDSVSFGRVPYKGIIMYTINAIKHGRVLEQEPSNSENPNNSTTKNDLGVDREDAVERLNALKQLIGYDKDSEIVKATQKSLDMAIKALEQEAIKPMVEIDLYSVIKQKYIEREVLDKIIAEIGRQEKWLMDAGYNQYNVDIAFNAIKLAVDKYKSETEADNGNNNH